MLSDFSEALVTRPKSRIRCKQGGSEQMRVDVADPKPGHLPFANELQYLAIFRFYRFWQPIEGSDNYLRLT